MDAITLLRTSVDHRAAKRWHPGGCEDYACGKRFDVATAPVASLVELAALLERLRPIPRMFVIRGDPRSAPAHGVLRRSRGDGAHFDEVPRHWVMLDVDSIDVPNFLGDPANSAALVREALPTEFRTAACYWHASGSAGFKPGARLHLWFWLSRPARSEEWRSWVRAWPVVVDASVFRTVQPHYTADPILEGVDDPMPLRSGTLPGEPEVDISSYSSENASLRAIAEKTLNSACRTIARTDAGDRNNMLYRQAARVAEFAPQLGVEYAKRKLIESSALPLDETAPTVESAFRNVEPRVRESTAWALGLTALPNARWAPTVANIQDVVELHPEMSDALATNDRTETPLWLHPSPWRSRGQLTDADGAQFARWLDRSCRFQGAGAPTALSALFVAAARTRIDPFRDWLDELEWDGTPRLDGWLTAAAHAPDTLYSRAVSKRWLISAVARTFYPGCKADCVLILVGAQGVGKSTLLRVLAGDAYFAEMTLKLGSDDAYMALLGPVIVELPELAALAKREVESVKADVSCQVDRRRPKYGRSMVDYPRRCVYAGSTNDHAMLNDPTGARRFLPVEVTSQADLGWLHANREQLWAEATALYRAGERWHLTEAEKDAAEIVRAEHQQADPLEEMLAHILREKQPTVGAIGETDKHGRIIRVRWRDLVEPLECKPTDSGVARRVAASLRRLGWAKKKSPFDRWYEPPEGWHGEA